MVSVLTDHTGYFLLPLEFRAYWKLSWPKARERIRTNWPNCLLGNLMPTHWEQQQTGKINKTLGLLGASCICLKFGFMSRILYSYIVCHHFRVKLIMAGIYNNWEAYILVSYTRICFALLCLSQGFTATFLDPSRENQKRPLAIYAQIALPLYVKFKQTVGKS